MQMPSEGTLPEAAFMNNPAGTRQATTGRFQTAKGVGGLGVSRPIGDRHYDVQSFTGYSMGTVPGTQWNRGFLYRFQTPMLRVPNPINMIDPSNPATWTG